MAGEQHRSNENGKHACESGPGEYAWNTGNTYFGEHAAEGGNKRGFVKHATKGGNKRDFCKHATEGGNKRDFGEHATIGGNKHDL